MSLLDQCIERGQQLFDIIKMKAGGRLVENEQHVPDARPLPRKLASFTRCASPPLSVSAALAEFDIAQANILQRLYRIDGWTFHPCKNSGSLHLRSSRVHRIRFLPL
jgi:hypothetical protein